MLGLMENTMLYTPLTGVHLTILPAEQPSIPPSDDASIDYRYRCMTCDPQTRWTRNAEDGRQCSLMQAMTSVCRRMICTRHDSQHRKCRCRSPPRKRSFLLAARSTIGYPGDSAARLGSYSPSQGKGWE